MTSGWQRNNHARVVRLQRVHKTCQGCRQYTSLSTPCHLVHPSTMYAVLHTHGTSACSTKTCAARLDRISHQKQNRFCIMSMLPASRTTAPGGVRACCHTVCLSAAHSSNLGRKCWLHNLSHSHKPCPLRQAAKATGMHCMHYTHSMGPDTHTPLQNTKRQHQQQAMPNNREQPTQAGTMQSNIKP